METTRTLNALNDTRTVTPNKYVWGEFTPDAEGIGYKELPVQTEVADTSTATLAVDVGGQTLVSVSIDTLKKLVNNTLPVGLILNYAFTNETNSPPTGFWRLDGSEFPNARLAIPQFVSKLEETDNILSAGNKLIISLSEWQTTYTTYGSCGKFAWNGTSLRFPTINHFIQGLSSISDLSKLVEAGLPNITGTFSAPTSRSISPTESGAFSGSAYGNEGDGDTGSYGRQVSFDASRSSSIYKNNVATVQPQSIKYPYIISIYNTISDPAEIDLTEVIESSVNKANTNLNNIVADGKDAIIDCITPDYANPILIYSGDETVNGGLIEVQSSIPFTQCSKTSNVVFYTSNPYQEDYEVYVSPNNDGTDLHIVGKRYDDTNGQTEGTSFSFTCPKGWYFWSNINDGYWRAWVYPFKGSSSI